MIPTMLIAGLLIGLVLRGRPMLAGTLVAAALWASLPYVGLSEAEHASISDWTAAFIFGASNTAVGVMIGMFLRISLRTARPSGQGL